MAKFYCSPLIDVLSLFRGAGVVVPHTIDVPHTMELPLICALVTHTMLVPQTMLLPKTDPAAKAAPMRCVDEFQYNTGDEALPAGLSV